MPNEDPDAPFVALLTEHQLALRVFVNSLVGGDAGSADLVQEVNSTVWKKRADFVPGTNFRAWVFQVARHHVSNYLRKISRERSVLVFDDRLQETMAAELADLPERSDDPSPQLAALRACLQSLRPADRQLIQHRYFHQTPLKDYAAQIGRTVGTLKVTLHRIRNSLEQCIARRLHAEGDIS